MNRSVVLYGECSYKLSLPENIEEADKSYYKKLSEGTVKGIVATYYHNVNVNYESQIFIDWDILPVSYVWPAHKKKYVTPYNYTIFLIKNYLIRRKVKYPDKSIWFVDDWSFTYFHWLAEALPRLFSVKNFFGDHTVFLPEYLLKDKYVSESLSLFSIPNIQYIPYRTVYSIKHLLIPSRAANTSQFHPSLMIDFRNFILNKVITSEHKKHKRRIYISRKNASRRKISNEEEVIEILKKYHFQVVLLENLSFIEQVRLLYQCEVVVSLHGAGLANVMFMENGAKVLELRHNHSSFWDCYYKLSKTLNLDYYYLKCNVNNLDSTNQTENYNHSNLTVNANKLKMVIERMLL